MKKPVIILLAVIGVLGVALGGAFLYLKGKRHEVVITQDQIDAALAKQFPMTKEHLILFRITYSNPQVTLLEDEDRVRVGLDAGLNIRIDPEARELKGSATVTSGLRYDSETQEFFLGDAVFERLEIQGIPEKWLDQVTEFASKAAREFIESKPIYRIEAKDSKTAAAKMLLKGFEVRDQAIHVSLGL